MLWWFIVDLHWSRWWGQRESKRSKVLFRKGCFAKSKTCRPGMDVAFIHWVPARSLLFCENGRLYLAFHNVHKSFNSHWGLGQIIQYRLFSQGKTYCEKVVEGTSLLQQDLLEYVIKAVHRGGGYSQGRGGGGSSIQCGRQLWNKN